MLHVLIGGTGTLGQQLIKQLHTDANNRIRVVARGEHRMARLRRLFPHSNISYIIGDVRDYTKLVDVLEDDDETRVYLLAALKHVHSCEYSVIEAVRTNIDGAVNVVRACRRTKNVTKAILISSDKAVEPITTYGLTKAVAERIFLWGNYYTPKTTQFAVVRYGNVLASQGSLLELWRQQLSKGEPITISDPGTTRFWWTVEQAAEFVLKAMTHARGGDILIPLMKSLSLGELKDLVAKNHPQRSVSCYTIEKQHELLLSEHELHRATLNSLHNFIRISYISKPPEDEVPWVGGKMSSLEYIDRQHIASLIGASYELSDDEDGAPIVRTGAQCNSIGATNQS